MAVLDASETKCVFTSDGHGGRVALWAFGGVGHNPVDDSMTVMAPYVHGV
jgi:hypothetical protein